MRFKKQREGAWTSRLSVDGNASIYQVFRAVTTGQDGNPINSGWCYTKEAADRSLLKKTRLAPELYVMGYRPFVETVEFIYKPKKDVIFETKTEAIEWCQHIVSDYIPKVSVA